VSECSTDPQTNTSVLLVLSFSEGVELGKLVGSWLGTNACTCCVSKLGRTCCSGRRYHRSVTLHHHGRNPNHHHHDRRQPESLRFVRHGRRHGKSLSLSLLLLLLLLLCVCVTMALLAIEGVGGTQRTGSAFG